MLLSSVSELQYLLLHVMHLLSFSGLQHLLHHVMSIISCTCHLSHVCSMCYIMSHLAPDIFLRTAGPAASCHVILVMHLSYFFRAAACATSSHIFYLSSFLGLQHLLHHVMSCTCHLSQGCSTCCIMYCRSCHAPVIFLTLRAAAPAASCHVIHVTHLSSFLPLRLQHLLHYFMSFMSCTCHLSHP
jgi:hypothetical protein